MEKYICEFCKKEHDGSYGSGRFCSKSCRMKFIASKVKRHVCNFNISTSHLKLKSPFGIWKCSHCDFIGETRAKLKEHQHKEHSQLCVKGGWNKGLTKETNISIKRGSETYINNIKNGKIIPGFKGRHHSKESRDKMSRTKIYLYKNGKLPSQRTDVKFYSYFNINNEEYKLQGLWELNVAKRLNNLGILWERNKTIKYFKEDNSEHRYIPDFYIPKNDLYIEVKGFYSSKDKEKMKLVLTQNNVKILFIDKTNYGDFINGKISLENIKMVAVV